MKVLFVGDVHAKVEDLADCVRLKGLVFEQVEKYRPAWVVFLGDQFDTHAVKHVEVEKFWLDLFIDLKQRFTYSFEVFALVGNHDRPGNAASVAHSLQPFRSFVRVVDAPLSVSGVLMLPYYHDPKELVKAANEHPDCKILVCHAAFAGGHYDNGTPIKADAFYGKDVVNPDDLPQQTVVSGHIHTMASFGKVWYPGSPRWFTMSDANRTKAIYLAEVGEGQVDVAGVDGMVETGAVCRRTWDLDYTPDDQCSTELALVGPNDKVRVNVKGPTTFCVGAKRVLQDKGYRVRAFPTDRGVAKVSEAEGIPAAFEKHFAGYKPKYGTSKEVLRGMLHERLHA